MRRSRCEPAAAQWLAEAVAAFGLVATILAGIRFNRPAVPWLVGLYITGGLLVHRVDVVCQSGSRHRAIPDQHVFRVFARLIFPASSPPNSAARLPC